MYRLNIYWLYNGDSRMLDIDSRTEGGSKRFLGCFAVYPVQVVMQVVRLAYIRCVLGFPRHFSMRFFCLSDNLEFGEGNRSKKATSKQDVRLLNTLLDLWATMPVTSVTLWPAGIWPRFKLNPSNEQAVAVSLPQLALSSLPACGVHVFEQFCIESI